jgi:hypothetical protein
LLALCVLGYQLGVRIAFNVTRKLDEVFGTTDAFFVQLHFTHALSSSAGAEVQRPLAKMVWWTFTA